MKSVALHVPKKMQIGGTQKIGQSLDMHTLIFSKIFNGIFFRLALKIYPPNLKSVALPVPGIRKGSY